MTGAAPPFVISMHEQIFINQSIYISFMKKLLTLAAAGLLGLSGAPQAAADNVLAVQGPLSNVTALEDGATYYIYDASKIQVTDGVKGSTVDSERRALRYADAANAVVKGNLSFSTTSTASTLMENPDQYRWIAEKDGENWKFKNVAFNQYINGSATLSATAATFTITYDNVRDAWLVGNGGNYWDGMEDGSMTTWTATDNGAHWYQFFKEETNKISTRDRADYITVNITFKTDDGITTGTKSVSGFIGHTYGSVPSPAYPLHNVVAEGGTFTAGQTELECRGGNVVLPFKATATEDWSNNGDNMIWQAVEVHGNSAKYMWTHVDGNALTTEVVDRPSRNGYSDAQLWAFIGTYADGFKIVNRAAGEGSYLTFVTNNGTGVMATQMVSGAENTIWKVYPTVAYGGQSPESYACFKLVQKDSETQFLNHNSNTNKLQTWWQADEGSSNRFFSAAEPLIGYYEANAKDYAGDTDVETAYNNAKSAPYNVTYANTLYEELNKSLDVETYNAIKALGDAFVTNLGLTGTDMANSWSTASTIEDAGKTLSAINRLKSAYASMVETFSKTADNVSLNLLNAKSDGNYMVPTDSRDMVCSNPGIHTDKRIFTIRHANDNGFYLFNEYTNKYVKSGTSASQQAQLVADRNAATVYTFKIYDYKAAKYLIAAHGQTGTAEMLHTDGYDAVVNWKSADNSAWSLSLVTEEQAVNEHLAGAKSFYNSCTPKGTALGEYTVADPAAAEAALNVGNDASIEEKRAAAAALLAVTPGGAGRFYRFKGVNENPKYLSSTEIGGRLHVIEDANGNKLETVWYYDGSHLVALSNGSVLNQCTKDNYHTVLSTDASAATVKFETTSTTGVFAICVSHAGTNRYIYNLNDKGELDAGSSAANNGYHWTIEQVNWLPIPNSNQENITLTSPVALAIKANMAAYTATVSNGKIALSEIGVGAGVIPANTPAVLHFDGIQHDGGTGLVYLQIVDDNSTITPNDLKGECTTKTQTEGTHYAVINGDKFIALAAGSNVPGFQAYIEVSDANDYPMTNAIINEILTSGKVYSIRSADGRGYLMNKDGQDGVWTSGKAGTTIDNNDANYYWTVVSDNAGKHYLYNLGAQKFASAYKKAGNQNAARVDFCWSFSDEPTAIDVQFLDWNLFSDILNILGGQNTVNDRPAGMMIINNDTNPVPCISGASARDGNGFIFTEIAGATAEGAPTADEIEVAKTAMSDRYAEAKAKTYSEEVANANVGYYTAEAFSAYADALNALADAENADAEAKRYAIARAEIAAGDRYAKTFEDGAVYNIKNADDGQYYRADIIKNADNAYETVLNADGNFNSEVIEYNWLSTVNDNGVTLSHSFQVAAGPAAPAARAAEDNVFVHNLVKDATPAYDGFGNVTLGENMVVKAAIRADNPETTAIEELSLDSKAGADVIYDLQGRRVNKATHGVYIVNGKKIYVK